MPTTTRAVVFDVFGTLVKIKNKQRPYEKLLETVGRRLPDGTLIDGAYIMAHSLGLEQTADLLGYNLSVQQSKDLHARLDLELTSIVLYPEVTDVLITLKEKGYKVGLCSNLAAPYSARVVEILTVKLDAYCWSYEAGAVKPSPIIYNNVCEKLECPPHAVLFVGDTALADYTGPRQFGMQARHLVREGRQKEAHQITEISEILNLL